MVKSAPLTKKGIQSMFLTFLFDIKKDYLIFYNLLHKYY